MKWMLCLLCLLVSLASIAPGAEDVPQKTAFADIDPLVRSSAYGDKTVWSYHAKDPVPWRLFRPRDYG